MIKVTYLGTCLHVAWRTVNSKSSSQWCSTFTFPCAHNIQQYMKLQEFSALVSLGTQCFNLLLLTYIFFWKKEITTEYISTKITVLALKTVSKAQIESKKASDWVHSSSLFELHYCSVRMIAARHPQVISTFIFYTKKSCATNKHSYIFTLVFFTC